MPHEIAGFGCGRRFRLPGRDREAEPAPETDCYDSSMIAEDEPVRGALVATTADVSVHGNTPARLRPARTCYDHIAGTLGVSLHDRFVELGWLAADVTAAEDAYRLTPAGQHAFESLGVDINAARALRRRFAYGCLDWSERRPHTGGALGAALLKLALEREWVVRAPCDRALHVTAFGRREMMARVGASHV